MYEVSPCFLMFHINGYPRSFEALLSADQAYNRVAEPDQRRLTIRALHSEA
jgi:hypothetical protein